MNKVVIDLNKCKECLYCINFCPKHVLEQGNIINKNGYFPPMVAKQEDCIACAICARVCPDGAISVYKDVQEEM